MKYILVLFITSVLFTQEIKTDSIASDSIKIKNTSKASTSVTQYFGDLVTFYQNEEGQGLSEYLGNAKIIYEDMQINAHRIIVNNDTKILMAYPKRDTLNNGKIDITGMPVFLQEGNDPMYGEKMEYNFDNRQGRVYTGKTEMKPSKYEGEEIKKIGTNSIFIRNGRFTTCDADSPSYWFHSDKIRMVDQKMIYTGPVVLHLHEIPFPIPLPFGIFNMEKGRRSGIFIPSYYDGTLAGRGLKNFGYYWAASDQYEAELRTDYYEKSGFHFDLSQRFRDRYNYNFALRTQYSRNDRETGNQKDDVKLVFSYNHKIDPSFSISGGGNYQSSVNINKYNQDINKQVNQTISSNISFNKRWDNGNSLSGNSNYRENLLTKRADATFPSLRFSAGTFKPFGEETGLSNPWYNKINMSYNSAMTNNWSQETALNDAGDYEVIDQTIKRGLVHNLSLSAPLKLFKYLTFNPNVSYKEVWVDRLQEVDQSQTDTLVIREVDKFGALRTFNFGASMNTNLYGLFEPNISSLKIVRHKLSPGISLNYTPDFTKEAFGYTQSVDTSRFNFANNSSKLRKRKDGSYYIDQYSQTPYGSTPSGEQLNASMRLGNTFSGKLIDDKGEESKLDILNFNSSTSYNFLADSLNWNLISSSFNFPFIKFMTFQGSMSHSLYELDTLGRAINKFASLPKLRRFALSSSIQLDQSIFGEADKEKDKNEDLGQEENSDLNTEARKELDEFNKLRAQIIPWNTSLSLNYNYDPYSSYEKSSFTSSINTSISLTEKWKMSHTMNYDINENFINYQVFRVTRDLECWNFSFNYTVQPFRKYFLLTISITEDMLKDLRYEKRSRNSIL